MSDLTLFGGNSLANSDLFKSLQDTDDKLIGSTGGMRRISLRGGRFRQMHNGDQIAINSSGAMNLTIVNAASIARTYYEGAYDPSSTAPPVCWSTDTQTPAPEVPADQRKASRCMDCPMNVKGSGAGESRACRFSQRLAVTLEGAPDEVYQLQLPATSIFGEAKDGKMGMQAYAKYLRAHKTPSIAVVTQMSFDEESDTPKLFFKAVRPLTEDELRIAVGMRDHEDAVKAITMTVSKSDKVKGSAATSYNPKKDAIEIDDEPAPKAKAAAVEPEEAEPKVAAKKSAPPPADDNDLASIVGDWD